MLMPFATTKKVLTLYFNVRKTLIYTQGYQLLCIVLAPALKTRVPQSHALKLYQYTQANPAAPHSRFQLLFDLKLYFDFRKPLVGCRFRLEVRTHNVANPTAPHCCFQPLFNLKLYFNFRKTLLGCGFTLEIRIQIAFSGLDTIFELPGNAVERLLQYPSHSHCNVHDLSCVVNGSCACARLSESRHDIWTSGEHCSAAVSGRMNLGFLGYICAMWFSRVISAVTLKMVQWGFVFSSTRISQCGSRE
ncbi:hypothetical protein BDZ97DRAFT_2076147 [Flammula alnicola]|nr:hypothetical protein BDZ97DRAFT_2076147 [Flammula alnicola]